MMKTTRVLLSLLALTLLVGAVHAQDADSSTPLVFFARGLYLLDETTLQVTRWNECGQGEGLRLSPTGEWLAQIRNHDRLRLCNLTTRQVIDVAAPGPSGAAALPSYPAWSPDSGQVAWSVGYQDGAHRLNVYDLDSGRARVLVEKLPPLDNTRPQVIWGESGILVAVDSRDESKRIAPLYSPAGELLQADLAGSQYFLSYFWVTDDDGKEYLGRYSNYVVGDVVDPETGESAFPAAIELYSPLAPDGLSVTMSFEPPGPFITLADGKPLPVKDLSSYLNDFVPYLQFDPTNVAIAPDGKALAFFDLDQLIWRDGVITPIPNSIPAADGTGVLWGPMSHRIVGELLSPLG